MKKQEGPRRSLPLAAVTTYMLVSLGVTGCGRETGGQQTESTSAALGGVATSPSSTTNVVSTTASRSTTSVVRLGCGQFCRNAGGYGGDDMRPVPVLEILTTGTVTVLPDGTVPIRLRCLVSVPCRGAIVLEFDHKPLADFRVRSDLDVPANGTITLGLQLSMSDFGYVQNQRRVEADVMADNALVPGCVENVAPGAPCHTFSSTPLSVQCRHVGCVVTPEPTDNLKRLIEQLVTLVAPQ